MRIAYSMEKFIYSKAEKIVFTFSGGKKYLQGKKWDVNNGGSIDLNKIEYITNGVDLDEFEQNAANYPTQDQDLLSDSDFKVLYIGSINLANNLKLLLDAAILLKSNKRIKFYIYGDGSERDQLELYAKQMQISNIKFKDKSLPFHLLPGILMQSSLNIMNYQKGFGEFGISPGKLALYLAAGKPILSNTSSYDDIIKKLDLGFSEDILSAKDYSDRILWFSEMPYKEYAEMSRRVKEAAKSIDYKFLSSKLIEVFNSNI